MRLERLLTSGLAGPVSEATAMFYQVPHAIEEEYTLPIEKEKNGISPSSSSRLRREERSDAERNPSSPSRHRSHATARACAPV